jgi:hypothetical protein
MGELDTKEMGRRSIRVRFSGKVIWEWSAVADRRYRGRLVRTLTLL